MLDMAKVIVIKDGVMSLGAGLKVFTEHLCILEEYKSACSSPKLMKQYK